MSSSLRMGRCCELEGSSSAVGLSLADQVLLVLRVMEQENDISGSTTVMPEAGGDGGPDKQIANGKRCLAAGDANGAVECFQEACSLLAAAHGQVAVELAEPYYLYGKALLELSRGSSSVLGSGIPVPDEKPSSDEEEEDEGGEEETEETATKEAGNGKPQNVVMQSTREIPEEDVASCSEPNQLQVGDNEPVTSSTNGEASGDAPVTNEVEEETEEESDLQIAWEVLELARVICQKFETNEYRLKLSDVNLLLGEVGLESDQYEQAIQDMKSSLQLRQFVLDSSDRKIAEVHFSLGLAYTLNKQLDEAIHEYKMSKQTLEKRKAKLEGKLSSEREHDEKQTLESEIKELSDLLPDIDSKIADVNEMKRLKEEKVKEEEGETSVGFANISDKKELDSPVETTDISHLIRKRPAAETVADASDNEPSAKRAHLDLVSSDVVDNGNNSKVEQEGKDGCHGDTSTVTSTACEQ